MNSNIDKKISGKFDKRIFSKIENRPWGNFEQFTKNALSTVKIIKINSNEKISLQYHNHREEFWLVLSGNCSILIGEDVFKAKEGDRFLVPQKIKHRIKAGSSQVQILEISFGRFDENDIIRLDDKYCRI